jgi:hypothetical protein
MKFQKKKIYHKRSTLALNGQVIFLHVLSQKATMTRRPDWQHGRRRHSLQNVRYSLQRIVAGVWTSTLADDQTACQSRTDGYDEHTASPWHMPPLVRVQINSYPSMLSTATKTSKTRGTISWRSPWAHSHAVTFVRLRDRPASDQTLTLTSFFTPSDASSRKFLFATPTAAALSALRLQGLNGGPRYIKVYILLSLCFIF